MPPNYPATCGQLLYNSTTFWAERTRWFPFKWATVAVLRAAANDSRVALGIPGKAAALAQAKAPTGADPTPPAPEPVPTLADLVRAAFDLVLMIYGPTLPFGGYWVRAARDFVLQYLDLLPIPVGLVLRRAALTVENTPPGAPHAVASPA
jgi:hypothetical protein